MTCKDCYHYGVCGKLHRREFPQEDIEPNWCGQAKEKRLILELPCKVGDTVYMIPTKENGRQEITQMKCLGFDIGEPSNTASCFDDKNKLYSAGFDMFGKSVFLEKWEAEKALEKVGGAENESN